MLPSSCAISFAYNAKCYAFLHTQQQKYASKHLRADSFAQQDFLRQEGSVCEHRKTNWWFALHSERKGKGKKQRESRQSPSRKIQQMDLASAITNITKRQLPDHHVCVCVMTLFKLWWFISHIKTCSALGEGLTWVNSVRTPGTPQKKLNDSIHWLARRADIEI